MSILAQDPYVTQLQQRLRVCGMHVQPVVLAKVLRHIGERTDRETAVIVELALTAFCLRPRPAWLMEIVGPRELQER